MSLFVPQQTKESIKLFDSDTMKDVIELANTIFWSIPSRNIMLEYYSPGCTVEFTLEEFLPKSYNERTMIGLKPNQNPTIELYCRPPLDTDKDNNYFARFSPSDPERIGIHPWMLDYCKRINKDSPGYNRIVFFGAISIVHESCHVKHFTFKELRGTVDALEPLNEAGEHYEFQLLQGRLEFIFKTFELTIVSEKTSVKVIYSPEAHKSIESPSTIKQTSVVDQDDNISDPKKRKQDQDISTNNNQEVFYTNVKLHLECDVKKIKKGDEHKYILETTIENTSDMPIEIPEKACPGVLNLQLNSSTRGGINPNERGKITRCIENMNGPRRTICPGQTHTYKFELNDLFKLASDFYQIKCQFTLQCSEKKKYFLTNISSFDFFVGSKSENGKPEVAEKLTLDLDPDFLEVIRLRPRQERCFIFESAI